MNIIRRHPYIFFVKLLIVGLLLFILIGQGIYPVAWIGGKVITANQFWDTYRAMESYSDNFVKTYGAPSSTPMQKLTDVQLELATLEEFVEEVAVETALRRETGSDFSMLVERRVSRYRGDEILSQAAQTLLNMSYDDFQKRVLLPQARKDLWQGRLLLQGRDYEQWLAEAKKDMKVFIFSPKFYWEGGQVHISSEENS